MLGVMRLRIMVCNARCAPGIVRLMCLTLFAMLRGAEGVDWVECEVVAAGWIRIEETKAVETCRTSGHLITVEDCTVERLEKTRTAILYSTVTCVTREEFSDCKGWLP